VSCTETQTDRQTLTTTIPSRPLDMGIQQSCSSWFSFFFFLTDFPFFLSFDFSFFPLLPHSIVKTVILVFLFTLVLDCQNEVAVLVVVVVIVVVVVVVIVVVVMVGAHRPGDCIHGREEEKEREEE